MIKQKKLRTVESFLIWFEHKTNRKVYIKVYSDSSGMICDAKTDDYLFEFASKEE